MKSYRVWDEDAESSRLISAIDPAEAAEAYVEQMSQVEPLESTTYEVKVCALEEPGQPTRTVKVSVGWEPHFYGEVVP